MSEAMRQAEVRETRGIYIIFYVTDIYLDCLFSVIFKTKTVVITVGFLFFFLLLLETT